MNDGEAGAPQDTRARGERVVGLIAEPGLAENVARDVADALPELLSPMTRGGGSPGARWRVEVLGHVLPLDASGNLRLLGAVREQRPRHWDAAVVLTELPRRVGTQPILADCVPAHSVALVSLTALGAFGIRRKTRTLLAHLITTCFTSGADGDAGGVPSFGTRRHAVLPRGYRTVDEREPRDEEEPYLGQIAETNVDLGGAGLHYALPGRRGRVRLLAVMVRANRPWRLVPSLSPALAGALAGAAFGIFYSSIWELSDASGIARLALVTVLSTSAMTAWLVLTNGLWERPTGRNSRRFSRLYNMATLLTVSTGVAIMFMLLFAATLLGACVVIPASYLSSKLGHSAGLSDFVTLAWLAACLGTLAGALGSGLADEGAVRRAAFSHRERERQDRRAATDDRTGP
ncbi:hypothetical protein ACFY1V_24545 [Streptomyces sp. NPDC001255]|uniref:hypothetical protein n=1 Tax=Streptomyces sp. NPDC001255 TaxID=3364550 RepID=UPI00369A8D6B